MIECPHCKIALSPLLDWREHANTCRNAKARHTPGPWFVSGARFKMAGGEWHSINRYDEAKKQDEGIACVGFDPRTGLGWADAKLIAAAPELLEVLQYVLSAHGEQLHDAFDMAHKAIEKATGTTRDSSEDRRP